jgi:hypothetical protein
VGILLTLVLVFAPVPAHAKLFEVGDVDGIIDLVFSYGILARTEDRDPDFIGIANGGNLASVNGDDGDLNYGTGIVSNQLRLSGDLTLVWKDFGLFLRGYGFYDFETQLGDRDHRELSGDGLALVGSGGELQEYYLSAEFMPWGTPVMFRVGNQILNWGQGSFLRFGIDIVNPLDFVSLLQPTASARDVFVPQGMVWAASNLSENIAIEGFYQYQWEPVIDAPVGWFFSADDLVGGDGVNFAMTGAGEFSDLGTEIDGVLVEDFMRIPSAGIIEPSDQGQFGFTVRALVPQLNAVSLAVHFVNYHSRLPLVSGITADQEAIDEAAATPPSEALLKLGELSNETHYLVTYPEDIQVLGFSIDGALPKIGTLVTMELSHHFNWPVQLFTENVLDDALSPLTDALGLTSVGEYGADELVLGIDESHKTQLSFSAAQAFGPTMWSSQSLLSVDVGWVHFDDLSPGSLADEDSWGYSIFGLLVYTGVLGGLNIEPFVGFTHDVSGITPGPSGAFLEDRKSVSIGVNFDYINRITANVTYFNSFDGEPLNAGADRDFVSFNIRYFY